MLAPDLDVRKPSYTTVQKLGGAVIALDPTSIEHQIVSGQYWTVAVPECLNCNREAGDHDREFCSEQCARLYLAF